MNAATKTKTMSKQGAGQSLNAPQTNLTKNTIKKN